MEPRTSKPPIGCALARRTTGAVGGSFVCYFPRQGGLLRSRGLKSPGSVTIRVHLSACAHHPRPYPPHQTSIVACCTSLLMSMAVLERGPLVGARCPRPFGHCLVRRPGENATLILPPPIAFARLLPRFFPPYSHPLCGTARTTPSPSPIPPFSVRRTAATLNVVPSPPQHPPPRRPEAHSGIPAATASVYGCAGR
jgi:hypothetical protein